jgi:PAS domain S-box-containing protein
MNNLKQTRRELVEEIHALREAIRFQKDPAEWTSLESNMIASAMDPILAIDEAQNIIQFNAAAERIFGYKASEVLGKPIHILLPEQFRESHSLHVRNFGKTGLTSRDRRKLGTLTGLRANGDIFPLEISITRVARESEILCFAIARDVSERVKLEGLLIRQFDSLNSLHQITLALLSQRDLTEMLQFIVDEAAKLLDAPYCEILLPENDELVAKAFTEGTPFPSGNRFTRDAAPLSWKVMDSGKPATLDDYSNWESHNRIFEAHHFHAAASIPILVAEKCIGVLGFARTETRHFFTDEDILSARRFAAIAALAMENSRLYREIEMLATTDELTGIRNRRSLMEMGEREVKRSIRYKRPLSILMLDADHFKDVNDTWGHPIGDIVLRGIAQQCLKQIRATDTVGRLGKSEEDTENIIGRFGGEEFVILLPETSHNWALLVAERIRSSIEAMSFHPSLENDDNSSALRVTVSIGVSSLDPERDTLLDLLTHADHALYTAKETGRNRVCVQDRA